VGVPPSFIQKGLIDGYDRGQRPFDAGAGGKASTDSAAILHTFSRKPWGVGVDHGLKPTGRRMRVTRASRNVVPRSARRTHISLHPGAGGSS